jgi:predicted HTH domain antitoxin
MTTVTLPLPIPDGLFEQLGLASQDQVPLELRFILAAKLFSDGRLSTGRAAEMAGMGKIAFMEELGRRHIPVVNWDEEEIKRELGNA